MRIKMTDFGLAIERSDQLTSHCGSLPYLAPEVFTRSYSYKVDLWSLGVITLELVAGLPRYPAGRHQDWPGLLEGRLETTSSDRLLYLFIQSLLQSDANNRPSAGQSLVLPFLQLDWFLQSGPVATPLADDAAWGADDAAWPTQIFAPVLVEPQAHPPTEGSPTEWAPTPAEFAAHTASSSGQPERGRRSQNAPSPVDQAAQQRQSYAPVPADPVLELQPQAQALPPASAPSIMLVPAQAPVMTYWKLKLPKGKVMYRPADGLVNATQLVKANGYNRELRWPAMEKKIGNLKRTSVNGRHIIGTYVSMSNAQRLLEHLKLDMASLKELTRQIDEHE